MADISQQGNTWHVSGNVLMDTASSILSKSSQFPMSDNIEVDFSAVTDLDTSMLSLMMEWQRRAAEAGSSLHFRHLPDNLNSLAGLYGVSDFISVAGR